MSQSPRVSRMVMFKHGVAYLERTGPAEGSFELSFKRDEMNDVLKSLTVWVAKGDAKIGAIGFEKPEDPEKALEERRLNFEVWQTMRGLIGTSRGRRVAIETPNGLREGDMVGAEAWSGGEEPERRVILLRTAEGEISIVDWVDVRGLRFLEASSRADLAFLLDRRRAATSGENRTVRVSVTGHAEDLRVSYVIPAPTWRVSYRLARGDAGTVLMAWGIVHNPADEDLDEIDLTLTTGQPVSFAIDLYHPKNIRRVVVEESSRALASAPTQFERAPQAPPPAAAPPSFAPPMGGGFGPPPAPQAPAAMSAKLAAFAEDAATYEDRGELFEYRVAQKISLRRGSSAMVPLLGTKVDANKERIWRDGSPAAPDLVLSFKNGTGAVLEEGPAVIYDEDVYAGEAMVPYSARGAEVKLAFAKDLGVRCKRTSAKKSFVVGIRLTDHFVADERREEEHHELRAESDHAEPVDVIFELRKTTRTIASEHAQPFEETSSYRRYRVTVPPHGKTTVTVVEQWHDSQRVEYEKLGSVQIAWWLENRYLDRATFDALAEIILLQTRAQELDGKRARVERDQAEAYTKQTKISEQLRVLKEGGPEGELRLRYVKELETEQDKVNACEAEVRSLRDGAEKARKEAGQKLRALTRPYGP